MARYLLEVWDKGGKFKEGEHDTFDSVLFAVKEWRRLWGNAKQLAVTNLDRCDAGDDGLTDEEREALE